MEYTMIADITPGTSNPPVSVLNKAALEAGFGAAAALYSIVADTVRGIADLRTKRATAGEVARRNAIQGAAAVGAGAGALIDCAAAFAIAAAPVITLPFMFFVGVGLGAYGAIGAVKDMWRVGLEIWDPENAALGVACMPPAGSGPTAAPPAAAAAVGFGVAESASAKSALVGRALETRKASAALASRKRKGAASRGWVTTKGLSSKQAAGSLHAAQKQQQQQMLMGHRKGHCAVDYCHKADVKAPRKAVFRRQQM